VAVRVQVILDEQERERFRRQALDEGKSLSAWLREAGRERMAARHAEERLQTKAALQRFFRACDEREPGKEPDWEQHLAVMGQSRGSGASAT